jgi:hypothetical protein
MTNALLRLRESENSFVIFGDAECADRYVQFATDASGSGDEGIVAARSLPIPVLVTASVGAPRQSPGFADPVVARAPQWASGSGYFGEPDHTALLMEVGSGLWPRSSARGLADDESVVARLAALGLHLGGGKHTCLNFCRYGVTEPSDILAALSDEIMVEIVHARPTYRLTIKNGHF